MPNNYLSVLYKHIIQVENKNVGLKVWGGGGGHKHTIAPHPPPLCKLHALPSGMNKMSQTVVSFNLKSNEHPQNVTHTHTHAHTYIYIYIYMCVCVCVCNILWMFI